MSTTPSGTGPQAPHSHTHTPPLSEDFTTPCNSLTDTLPSSMGLSRAPAYSLRSMPHTPPTTTRAQGPSNAGDVPLTPDTSQPPWPKPLPLQRCAPPTTTCNMQQATTKTEKENGQMCWALSLLAARRQRFDSRSSSSKAKAAAPARPTMYMHSNSRTKRHTTQHHQWYQQSATVCLPRLPRTRAHTVPQVPPTHPDTTYTHTRTPPTPTKLLHPPAQHRDQHVAHRWRSTAVAHGHTQLRPALAARNNKKTSLCTPLPRCGAPPPSSSHPPKLCGCVLPRLPVGAICGASDPQRESCVRRGVTGRRIACRAHCFSTPAPPQPFPNASREHCHNRCLHLSSCWRRGAQHKEGWRATAAHTYPGIRSCLQSVASNRGKTTSSRPLPQSAVGSLRTTPADARVRMSSRAKMNGDKTIPADCFCTSKSSAPMGLRPGQHEQAGSAASLPHHFQHRRRWAPHAPTPSCCCSMRCTALLPSCSPHPCAQQWLDTCTPAPTHPNPMPLHHVRCITPKRPHEPEMAPAAYCEGMCQLLLLSAERVGLAGASAGAAALGAAPPPAAAAAVSGWTSTDKRRLARVIESCLPQANRPAGHQVSSKRRDLRRLSVGQSQYSCREELGSMCWARKGTCGRLAAAAAVPVRHPHLGSTTCSSSEPPDIPQFSRVHLVVWIRFLARLMESVARLGFAAWPFPWKMASTCVSCQRCTMSVSFMV